MPGYDGQQFDPPAALAAVSRLEATKHGGQARPLRLRADTARL